MRRAFGLALALMLVMLPSVYAQISTGNVYGQVTDDSGAVLPGATITMAGPQATQARDPWAVLRTVPGVVVDRVSIAGNEGGQQAGFQGKGADTADTQWNLDGVVIDDMSAAGASPGYFDYDAFEEFAVTTGGQ